MKRTYTLLCGLLLAHSTACLSDDQIVDETSEATDEVGTTVGIERIIPIHYYVLDNYWTPCTLVTNDSAIHEGIRIANRNWQKAGIQFSATITRTTGAPSFMYLTDTLMAYSSVWPQLRAIAPSLTATSYPADEAHSNEDWLFVIGDKLPRQEIPLIVPCTDIAVYSNGHSAFPDWEHSHNIHIPPAQLDKATVSHELGHYFSLVHDFDAFQNEAYDELYGYDVWGNVTFFHSAVEVATFASGWFNQVLKKDGRGADWQPICRIPNPDTCEMECTWGSRVYKTPLCQGSCRMTLAA